VGKLAERVVRTRSGRVSILGAALVIALSTDSIRGSQGGGGACRPSGQLVRIPEVPEASGIAVSRRIPGRLWTHNDSGKPILFGIDAQGAVKDRVELSGATVEDWEAIAVGPCDLGSCVYVGDIGDNDARRKGITIYRIKEPAAGERTANAEAFHASYPDGAHDAEALLVTPAGALFIVTKGDTGAVGLYRFPHELRPGATMRLEQVGGPRDPGKEGADDRITDGAVSGDGGSIVLRTRTSLTFYRASELLAGSWREVRKVPVDDLREPQGEGVAFAADDALYLAGEGEGKSQPGTLIRLVCPSLR
jgi:hypothetical protein